MKFLLSAAFLILPVSSPAASSWETSTEASIAAYRKDFKAERSKEAAEPVGFAMERGDNETITTVYFQDEAILRSYIYGCHRHGAVFDCHKEDRGEYGAYKRLSSHYKAEQIAQSIAAALDMFVKKVGPESTIRSTKVWEAEEMIRFSFAYENGGIKNEYMACHFHDGKEMDCHRKGSSGPGEPGKK